MFHLVRRLLALIVAIAVVLMRTEPDPETRPRLVLGSAMIGLPVLGLWHLWSGSPADPAARMSDSLLQLLAGQL